MLRYNVSYEYIKKMKELLPDSRDKKIVDKAIILLDDLHNANMIDEYNKLNSLINEKMPKAKCVIPEGSYVIWLDLRGYNLSDEEIKHKIINEAHLVLQGGSNFDSIYGQQFQRICIPSPRSMIQEAFERLYRVFE